jgi:hypothetical protein
MREMTLAVCYLCGVTGGPLLFSAPLFGKGRHEPQWTRMALWFLGFITFFWGLCGLILLHASPWLSRYSRFALDHTETSLAGGGLTLVLFLFASRALRFRRGTKNPDTKNNSRNETSRPD